MTAPAGAITTTQSGSANPWNAGKAAWGSTQTRKRPKAWGADQQADPAAPQGQQGQPNASPAGLPPTTFAQMQAQGQARPAPAQPQNAMPQAGSLPQMTSAALRAPSAGGTYTGTPNDVPGYTPATPPAITETVPPASGTAPPPYTPGGVPSAPVNVPTPAIGGQLQDAVGKALSTGSRYDLPQVQQVRDTLTAQLGAQFGAQKKQLDEEMARRGIGSSSIAGGYYGDLQGQQDQALAGLNASLIQDQASTSAADIAASLGAGQGLYNTQAQQGLGAAQLGVQNTLGQGSLTLGQNQLAQQGGQFGQTLAQNKDLATMGDVTANRGLDIQGQLAQNDLMMRVAQTLAGLGYPTTTGTTGTGTTGGTTGTGKTAVPTVPNPSTPTTYPTPHDPGTFPPISGAGSAGGGGGGSSGGDGSGGSEEPAGGLLEYRAGLPGQVAGALGPGNAGAPNVPGAGTPNAPNGPVGPSGQQQGPDAPPNFAVAHPSANIEDALGGLSSTTGISPQVFGLSAASSVADVDRVRGIMAAIGNRQPAAIEAGKNDPNPFVRRTAYAYALGYGGQGLPDAVAQQLGVG